MSINIEAESYGGWNYTYIRVLKCLNRYSEAMVANPAEVIRLLCFVTYLKIYRSYISIGGKLRIYYAARLRTLFQFIRLVSRDPAPDHENKILEHRFRWLIYFYNSIIVLCNLCSLLKKITLLTNSQLFNVIILPSNY